MCGQRPAAGMSFGRRRDRRDGAPWDVERAPAPTLVTGIAAGLEYECGTRGRGFAADHAIAKDDQPPVEELADVDRAARIGARPRQLHPAGGEPHGIVPGHDPAVAAT